MTNPAIEIGARMIVKDGRYKGHLVEVLELKDSSVRCKFVDLNESETKQQQSGSDFEPIWLGQDVLEPETPGTTSTRSAHPERA